MNFILFTIVALVTLILTLYGASQIIGIIFIKLPKKDFKTIIGLIFWSIVMFLYYLVITNWFDAYYNVYIWCSIIAIIIVIFNFDKLKKEKKQQ